MTALMLRPGLLTREYYAGRRRRHIRPGRLFLVTSIAAFAAIRYALRYGPYAAIVLLPAFALLLMLAYPLANRRYPHRPRRFAAHMVFTAHNHAFLFVLTVVAIVLPWPTLGVSVLTVAATIHLLRAMRVVYGGGMIPTLARAFALFVAYVVLFATVTSALLVAAVLLQ